MEIRDKSGFRVKFTGGEKKKVTTTGKEMILGNRIRPERDFNKLSNQVL